MKLSQIKLAGFKSFVDHTTIDIKGQLAGIVGPNGCGKSNVIDAVRWVLGESSAKQLRGESMHDVIFNGSVSRKPVSRASVELVFNNQKKILTNAWNSFDEISIKRLLTRSGESIYSINNQTVRRKDITELFLGTGVGTKGYAVIEQGMISKIIDARPEDLRMYLEEAAGVSKYREKRKETLSRLEYTRENIVRLEDIKIQLSDNIEILTKQAATAKHYQELSTEHKQLQLTQLLVKMDKAKSSLAEVNLNIQSYQKTLNQSLNENELIDNSLEQQSAQKQKEEQRLLQLTENFNQLRSHIARLEERHKYKLETGKRLVAEEAQLQQQIVEVNAQIIVISDAIEDTKEAMTTNAMVIDEKELLKESKFTEFTELEAAYQKSLSGIAGLANKAIEAKHEHELLKNSRQHKEQQYNNLHNRYLKLEQETPANTLDLEHSYTLLKEEIEEINFTLEELAFTIEDKKEIKQNLESRKSAQLSEIHQCKNQISGINAKSVTLEKLLKQSAKTEDLTKVLANANQILPLWQGIQVQTGYEIAVEVVLGHVLSAIAVDSLTDLLKEPNDIVALWHGIQNSVAKKGTLSEYVTINDEKYLSLYNILNQYIIADGFIKAQELVFTTDNTIITQDGHLLTKDYVIFHADHGQSHVLEYQNQLNELVKEHDNVITKLANLEKDYQANIEEFNRITVEMTASEQSHRTMLQQKHALQLEFTKQEQSYQYNIRHQEKISNEIAVLTKEISYIKEEISHIESQIDEQAVAAADIQIEESAARDAHSEFEHVYNQAKNAIQEIESQIRVISTDNQLLQQRLTSSSQLIVEKEAQLASIDARIEIIKNDSKDLSDTDESIEVEVAKDEITQAVQNIEQQNEMIRIINDKLNQIKDSKAKLNNDKDSLNDKLNQSMFRQQEYVLSMQNIQENIDNLQMTDYVVEEIIAKNILSLQQIQDKLTKIRQELDALGLVNLKAIEDLTEAEAKFTQLDQQVDDLNIANAALEAAIKQIDAESRKLLHDTYTKVNENFNNYFKILFGGGRATLALTEDDILISGLSIYAEPLGKKNTSLHLLSGGEKALTAMSLVFALFSLNPAPFCILDEVDAPLDDANTMRFCNLVKELSIYTQFIYITHNRLAMEMAEQLIGVTMQEKGVSTTVGVNLVDSVQ